MTNANPLKIKIYWRLNLVNFNVKIKRIKKEKSLHYIG